MMFKESYDRCEELDIDMRSDLPLVDRHVCTYSGRKD